MKQAGRSFHFFPLHVPYIHLDRLTYVNFAVYTSSYWSLKKLFIKPFPVMDYHYADDEQMLKPMPEFMHSRIASVVANFVGPEAR